MRLKRYCLVLVSPCMDISPDQCAQLKSVGQCSTQPTVAFMCAKSCGTCIHASTECVDRFDSCKASARYCLLPSIQEQCPRTCNACRQVDQEGTTAAVGNSALITQSECQMIKCSAFSLLRGGWQLSNEVDLRNETR